MELLTRIYDTFLGGNELRIAPLYVATMLLIAIVIFRVRMKSFSVRPFLKWMFPREVYFHPSHIVDLKVFFVGRLIALAGVLNLVVVKTATIALVLVTLRGVTGTHVGAQVTTWSNVLLVTLVFFVVSDFCTYWIHRIHHETAALWPFHAVHHSAEVMSPITVYRKHPIYDFISSAARGVMLGVAVGCVLFFVTDDVSMIVVGNVSIVYVLFNLAGANFRHSHIWISYGPVLERIFISPAQHQVHHSSALEHHNKNYGEILALWDWMFGTLYVPRSVESLTFGLADADGKRIEQPHGTLAKVLAVPFVESWRALRVHDEAEVARGGVPPSGVDAVRDPAE